MALSVETLVLAKKFTRDTVNGLGALKGSPCTIKTIDKVEGGNRIEFEWTGADGALQTSSVVIEDGESGISVKSIKITADNHLVCELSDGNIIDAGEIDNASIDDSKIAEDTTWSSQKIKDTIGRWVGTAAEFEKVKHTLPEGTIVVITDDGVDSNPGLLCFSTFRAFPALGNTQTLYIDIDTNIIYRFDEKTLTYKTLSGNINIDGAGIVTTPDGVPVQIVDNNGLIVEEAMPEAVVTTTNLIEIQGII